MQGLKRNIRHTFENRRMYRAFMRAYARFTRTGDVHAFVGDNARYMHHATSHTQRVNARNAY